MYGVCVYMHMHVKGLVCVLDVRCVCMHVKNEKYMHIHLKHYMQCTRM